MSRWQIGWHRVGQQLLQPALLSVPAGGPEEVWDCQHTQGTEPSWGCAVPAQWLHYQVCCFLICRLELLLAPAHGEEWPARAGLGCLVSLCSSRERQCHMWPWLSHQCWEPSWLRLLCSGRRGHAGFPEGLFVPSFVLPTLKQHWAPAGWGWEAASHSDLLCPSVATCTLHSKLGTLGLHSAVLLL